MSIPTLIAEAIKEAGGQAAVAKECGLSQPGVYKWTRKGLPRTEWTGETDYASVLVRMTKGKYTREQLLAACRSNGHG